MLGFKGIRKRYRIHSHEFEQETNVAKCARPTHFVRVVWEIDFVKYLRGFVLYSLHFYLVRGVLPLAVSQGFLQPLQRVLRYGMPPRAQKQSEFLERAKVAR